MEMEGRVTLELLQHALDGARAAAAGHADIEDVVVLGVGHCVWWLSVALVFLTREAVVR